MLLRCLIPIGDVVVFFYKLVFAYNTLILVNPHAKRHFLAVKVTKLNYFILKMAKNKINPCFLNF